MKLPTRVRIVNYLRKQKRVSSHDLSRVLGMTGANIRHHMAILETNGLVEVIGRQRDGRGRPGNVYALSRAILDDGLDQLAEVLLDELVDETRVELLDKSLHSIAKRMARGFPGDNDPLFARRLTCLARYLEKFHYQARWEAGVTGARIILDHCPFSAIVSNHPELCRLDRFLLEECLGRQVIRITQQDSQATGTCPCVFQVKQG